MANQMNQQTASNWPKYREATDFGTLSFYRTGGPKTTLVLLHGLTDNAMGWSRVAMALKDRFDLILLDSPGHGDSDMLPLDTIDQTHHYLMQLLDKLSISTPVILGHSMGALAAAKFACTYPDVPSMVILEDPPLRQNSPEKIPAAQLIAFQRELEAFKATPDEELIAIGRRQHPDWHHEDHVMWAEAKKQANASILGHYRFAQWRDYIDGIKAPALLLHGSNDQDGIIKQTMADRITTANPAISSVRIDGAGHHLHRTHLDEFLTQVQAFIKQHST